jgi:predicted  nucleic acid-binding Zn-ribbon protein
VGELTLSEIADAAKIVTAIVAAITAFGGVFVYFIKQYLKPINDRLDSIDNKLNNNNLELVDVKKDINQIKVDISSLTTKESCLETKISNNRNLDALLVKTLRLMLNDSDIEQRKLKSELDSYLIDEAVIKN